MRKGTGAKWKKSSPARGFGSPGGDSGGGSGLGVEPMRMTAGRRARRGFKLPGFISINTAVATVCASSAGDRSSSAGVEEVENEREEGEREEKRGGGCGDDRKNES